MHRSENRDSAVCASCGATLFVGEAREFAFGGEDVLCFDCAERRGGGWDERLGRWAVAPDVADLRREDD